MAEEKKAANFIVIKLDDESDENPTSIANDIGTMMSQAGVSCAVFDPQQHVAEVLVTVSGGNVQGIYADSEHVKVTVMDFDKLGPKGEGHTYATLMVLFTELNKSCPHKIDDWHDPAALLKKLADH